MKIFTKIHELRDCLRQEWQQDKTIGFIPTMGALHQGHQFLVAKSVESNDLTVVSIFVNPTQFNNQEDLQKYPNRASEDKIILENCHCDFLFMPSVDEMYPNGSATLSMNFGVLERVLEGEFRPSHFSGVGVIVSKLLNIVQPDVAYFGQKDLQQLAVIKKMVIDLNFQTEIVGVTTARESSGLAMSSRNMRLSPQEKKVAAIIYQRIDIARVTIREGGSIQDEKDRAIKDLQNTKGLELEYLGIVNSETMESVAQLGESSSVSICVAAHVGEVRIIDNIYIKERS